VFIPCILKDFRTTYPFIDTALPKYHYGINEVVELDLTIVNNFKIQTNWHPYLTSHMNMLIIFYTILKIPVKSIQWKKKIHKSVEIPRSLIIQEENRRKHELIHHGIN
jgi:hypothetical protein